MLRQLDKYRNEDVKAGLATGIPTFPGRSAAPFGAALQTRDRSKL
jgi:hypothetical protein